MRLLLVLGNGGQSALYLNDGTGTFTDATAMRLPVGTYQTQSVALGDVDRDGDLDLVLGNFNEQSLLFLNDGSGRFTDETSTRLPVGVYRTRSVALGDVDGDGDLDLVLGNLGDQTGNLGQSRLYMNGGQGTFTDATATRLPTGSYESNWVALGDVDRDGDLDLVLGNWNGQTRLYLNNRFGVFTDATARLPTGSYYTRSVALGDVDGDGDLDLVLGNGANEQSRLYLNDGTGAFTDATATHLPAQGFNTYSVVLGDVDGDGDLDLVRADYNQQSLLYLNNGMGVFTDASTTRLPAASYPTTSAALGDVDGDGDIDLVLGSSLRSLLYLNDGTGRFTDATATRLLAGTYHTYSAAFGDLDGDGDLDLVVGNFGPSSYGQQSRLYLNDGTGAYADATDLLLPDGKFHTASVALGDVDGDGDIDLVLGNSYEQSCLYLNSGAGAFTDVTATHLPAGAYQTASVALADVDGDGDLDLVLGNSYEQSRLYLNSGAGAFADVTATHLPTGTYSTTSVAFGDVDGDGDPDLVLGNSAAQSRLYLNGGTGTFTDVTGTHLPGGTYYTQSVGLGDVDGDGDLDVVLGNRSQQVLLYLNNGAGVYLDATVTRLPAGSYPTESVALGDMDGDGDLDVVLGNFGQQQTLLYLNDGTGTFVDATTRVQARADLTHCVVLGDVDGDGDLDLFLGNVAERNRLYVNLQRQLDTPFVLHTGRSYELDVYARYGPASATTVALPFLATATTSILLPPFGTFRLDPTRMLALPLIQIPQSAGVGALSFPVPNNRSLGGLPIHTQALIVHGSVSMRLTNRNADIVLR